MVNVSVNPRELKFRFEVKKQIPVLLTLHNHEDFNIAYKVKTTSPKKYIVRPSSGVICAKGICDVQVAKFIYSRRLTINLPYFDLYELNLTSVIDNS
jgi:hypothetical protein